MSDHTISLPTYIIGHKNPDIDAICAPLAYATFKKTIGQPYFVAARCGNLNARIETVLNRFHTPAPLFLGDVTPRVKDIMVKDVHSVFTHSTCFEALSLIDEYDVRALPVIDNQRFIKGIVSIFDLGQYFVPKPQNPRLARYAKTCAIDIVKALKATIHYISPHDEREHLLVRIAAMNIDSLKAQTPTDPVPTNQTIILVGDREDVQVKAIEMGIRLLVLTNNLQINPQILKKAIDTNVSVISSPYDAATTAWIIRSAEQIEFVMQPNVIVCNAEEKLSQAHRKLASSPVSTVMVVDDNQKLVGIFSKGDLVKPLQTQLILVDHNELSQAIDGANEVNILEIIDHHKLGNPTTQQPILFRNEPVGSTCTIIAEFFKKEGLNPTPDTAGLMMSGLISDTLNLKGPTTTQRDIDILKWLEPIAGITGSALNELIFSSGSMILTQAPDTIVRADCKIYEESNGIRYAVSQIEELGLEHFWQQSQSLITALEKFQIENQFFFVALLVTDINTQNSVLLVKGHPYIIDHIQYPILDNEGIYDLPGIVSRKKQLVPYLTTLIKDFNI